MPRFLTDKLLQEEMNKKSNKNKRIKIVFEVVIETDIEDLNVPELLQIFNEQGSAQVLDFKILSK